MTSVQYERQNNVASVTASAAVALSLSQHQSIPPQLITLGHNIVFVGFAISLNFNILYLPIQLLFLSIDPASALQDKGSARLLL